MSEIESHHQTDVLRLDRPESKANVPPARSQWTNRIDYLLIMVGFAVGIGNIWRFPFLCQTYGGGAFLIPYCIALVFEGIPLMYVELSIGQRLRSGSIGVWSTIHPCFIGIGISAMFTAFTIGLFYNVIITWVIWYFMNSFQQPLPWQYCPLTENRTEMVRECAESSPTAYFWYRETLNVTTSLEEGGGLQWWLVVCLCLAWIIVYICTSRGIETSGKAAYVTATFPYVVLFCFLIGSLTLEGATNGLVYLFTPDVEILKNPKVWMDAATQIFFSLGLGVGSLIAFSSYNPIKNDCEKDAVVVSLINSATSIFASIPVFAILGFKATMNFNTCMDRNVLLLINEFDAAEGSVTRESYSDQLNIYNQSYPHRVSLLDLMECNLDDNLNELWAILFFTMLFMLGLSSMFGYIEALLTPLLDLKIFPHSWPKEAVQALVCLVFMLLALTFTQGSGNYWLSVFNDFAGSVPLLFITLLEVLIVVHVYGFERLSKDMEFMIGHRPNLFWKATICFISPLMLFVVLVAYIVDQATSTLTYQAWNPQSDLFPKPELLHYPAWMIFIIVIISGAGAVFIVVAALVQCLRGKTKRPHIPPPSEYDTESVQP
uniref:sodium-dependent neutral amino acid transporter B(0)AT1-like isoform X2 n=1 Tax=Myxine glutinosa TaxID=7769 RepID=UPI00358EC6F6